MHEPEPDRARRQPHPRRRADRVLQCARVGAAARLARRRRVPRPGQGLRQRRQLGCRRRLRPRQRQRRLAREGRPRRLVRVRARRQHFRPPLRWLGHRQRRQCPLLRAGARPQLERRGRGERVVLSAGTIVQFLGAEATRERLPFAALVAALRAMFERGCELPPRQLLELAPAAIDGVTSLVMPAWQRGGCLGVKVVNIAPGNAARGLPALHSTYVLYDATTGVPLAWLDGDEITARRTAATSALAASWLARAD